MSAIGSNPDNLEDLARRLDHAGSGLNDSRVRVSSSLNDAYWEGFDAQWFRESWYGPSSSSLRASTQALHSLATLLRNEAAEQRQASDAGSGSIGPDQGSDQRPSDVVKPVHHDDSDQSILELLLELWKGTGSGRAILTGISDLKYAYGLLDVLPTLNNGLLGKLLAGIPKLGPWLKTPGATNIFRGLGIFGGVLSTGLGLYGLYQQGNPIDAFRRDPGSYASDVAGTAFSASATAFLIAPNPVTAILSLGTGIVWAGTEVWDHWDQISSATDHAWDSATMGIADAWDAGADLADDIADEVGDFASDVRDTLTFWD